MTHEHTNGAKELHPAVVDLLSHFQYDHLPEHLQHVSKPLHDLAHSSAAELDGPQLSHGLMHLLQAKDCLVRAAVTKHQTHPAPEHHHQK